MPKLTLSVDEKVVRSAKRYAAAQGTSVSRLVERYLDLLSRSFDMAAHALCWGMASTLERGSLCGDPPRASDTI